MSAKSGDGWLVPTSAFVAALALSFVAGPAGFALRAPQAVTGPLCPLACEIGERGGVQSSIPDNGILSNLNGDDNRGSIDHSTTTSGYEMVIFAEKPGGAGPIHDRYTNPISGSTDEMTSFVDISQDVTVSLNISPPPPAGMPGSGWLTLDHDLTTVINGVRQNDGKLVVIMANGKKRGGNAVGPPEAPGLDGTTIEFTTSVLTSTFVGDCVEFGGQATVKARLHVWVSAPIPQGSKSIDGTASAADLVCNVR